MSLPSDSVNLDLAHSYTEWDCYGLPNLTNDHQLDPHDPSPFAWTVPWRTPQDCREGGLALLDSMTEILANVKKARASSMQEVYTMRPSSTTIHSRGTSDVENGSMSMRLSMRRSNRAQSKSSVHDTRSDVSAVTLKDYMMAGPSQRHISPMWLEEHSALSISEETSGGGRGDEQASRSAERSSFSHWRDDVDDVAHRAGASEMLTPSHASVHEFASNFPTPQMPPLTHPHRSSASLDLHTDTGAQEPPENTSEGGDDRPSVPAIPRFDEFLAEKEKLLLQLAATQPPHPRSLTGMGRSRGSPVVGGDEEEAEASHCNSLPFAGSTARPIRPSIGATERTGRPSTHAPNALSDEFKKQEKCEPALEEELRDGKCGGREEEEEEDDDPISADEFGEGGHLASVPGDTLHSRYMLLQPLGVGRSSRVWLAVDLEQCSVARRQLIRELGEREVRRLFRPSQRPMFVAIKVFRCGSSYSSCAMYEWKLSTMVRDTMKLDPLLWSRSLSRSSPLLTPSQTSRCMRAAAAAVAGEAAVEEEASEASDSAPLDMTASHLHQHRTSLSMDSTPSLFSGRAQLEGRDLMSTATQSSRLLLCRDTFTVDGAFGTHHCLVMDVLGTGVDVAINEGQLRGFSSDIARSILRSSLQGLAVLSSCHLIHTDLKPENLLFTDLAPEMKAEMLVYQQQQLHTTSRSLWSSSTHCREHLLDYNHRKEMERRGHPSVDAAPEQVRRNSSPTLSSVAVSDGDSVAKSRRDEKTVWRMPSLAAGTPVAVHGDEASSPSPFRNVAPSSRRIAYEVCVADFGLSYITPPALRLGLQALVSSMGETGVTEMGSDDLVAQDPLVQMRWLLRKQQQWSTEKAVDEWSLAETAAVDIVNEAEVTALEAFEQNRFVSITSTTAMGGGTSNGIHCQAAGGPLAMDGPAVNHSTLCSYSSGSQFHDTHSRMEGPPAPCPALQTASYHSQVSYLIAPPKLTQEAAGSSPSDAVISYITSDADERERPRNYVSLNGAPPPLTSPSEEMEDGGGCFYESGPNPYPSPCHSPAPSKTLLTLRQLELDVLRHQRYSRGITIQSREYRSPEVLLGNYFLPSCDVWSVGCIAYELIVGHFLFDSVANRAAFAESLLLQESAVMEEADKTIDAAEWTGDSIYVEEPERDVDVFHLKLMMQLLGPPPLSYLRQHPVGLYVDDFYDAEGRFRYWEEGEAERIGVAAIEAYHKWTLQHEPQRDGGAQLHGECEDHPSGAAPSPGLSPLSPLVSRSPGDTSNYPIVTPRWREVQERLREALQSDEEARYFEGFLQRCLQWDPARRATPAELCEDDWIVKYHEVVADAVTDSDAEDEAM